MTEVRRGTSNGNLRGSSTTRRARRAWLVTTYASNVRGLCRCYRCGVLLFNADCIPPEVISSNRYPGTYLVPSGRVTTVPEYLLVLPLTVDRIIPGCQGGTYRRTNIRPACGDCNSETGGGLRRSSK